MSRSRGYPAAEFNLEPAPMRIGRVQLAVRDVAKVSHFYQDVLGLAVVEKEGDRISLGAADGPLLDLISDPTLEQVDPYAAGLFHIAFLLPDRSSLAQWFAFVMKRKVRLQGASNHRVSEAIYLADPEGNGIEVYADRPVNEWRTAEGEIEMPSDPLDLQDLLATAGSQEWIGIPACSVIGHVHLQVGDIAAAERFYRDVLGFEVTFRIGGASFFRAGGYHHQLAANTWRSQGAGMRPGRSVGLKGLELVIRDAGDRDAIKDRAWREGFHGTLNDDGAVLSDSWGIAITLAVD